MARLHERQLDLALLPGVMETPGLERMAGWTERFIAALPENHPLAGRKGIGWADLEGETIIVRAFESAAQIQAFLTSRLAGDAGRSRLQQHDVSRDSLLNLVGMGQGIAIATDAAAALDYPGVVFRPIEAEDARLPISLVWSPENANPVLYRFLSFAKQRKEAWMPEAAL